MTIFIQKKYELERYLLKVHKIFFDEVYNKSMQVLPIEYQIIKTLKDIALMNESDSIEVIDKIINKLKESKKRLQNGN